MRPTKGNVFIEPEFQAPSAVIHQPEAFARREMPQIGRVVAIGGARKFKSGLIVKPEFKPGDRVVFRKFSGLWSNVSGKELIQVKQHDVEAVLE